MAVQSGSQVSTRLSDVPIVPEIATAAIILRSLNSNAFVNSGVMIRDPEADASAGKLLRLAISARLPMMSRTFPRMTLPKSPRPKRLRAGKIRLSGKASTSRGLRWI